MLYLCVATASDLNKSRREPLGLGSSSDTPCTGVGHGFLINTSTGQGQMSQMNQQPGNAQLPVPVPTE